MDQPCEMKENDKKKILLILKTFGEKKLLRCQNRKPNRKNQNRPDFIISQSFRIPYTTIENKE